MVVVVWVVVGVVVCEVVGVVVDDVVGHQEDAGADAVDDLADDFDADGRRAEVQPRHVRRAVVVLRGPVLDGCEDEERAELRAGAVVVIKHALVADGFAVHAVEMRHFGALRR